MWRSGLSAVLAAVVVGLAGCDGQGPTCVELYRFGRTWVHSTRNAEDYPKPADQRRARAYLLLHQGRHGDASRCFYALYGTDHDADAKAMAGVILASRAATARRSSRSAGLSRVSLTGSGPGSRGSGL